MQRGTALPTSRAEALADGQEWPALPAEAMPRSPFRILREALDCGRMRAHRRIAAEIPPVDSLSAIRRGRGGVAPRLRRPLTPTLTPTLTLAPLAPRRARESHGGSAQIRPFTPANDLISCVSSITKRKGSSAGFCANPTSLGSASRRDTASVPACSGESASTKTEVKNPRRCVTPSTAVRIFSPRMKTRYLPIVPPRLRTTSPAPPAAPQ
jgi:hypothetical protein